MLAQGCANCFMQQRRRTVLCCASKSSSGSKAKQPMGAPDVNHNMDDMVSLAAGSALSCRAAAWLEAALLVRIWLHMQHVSI
jgi:hypothetical protein